ncbi:hypothetical protein RvY_04024 [Ramazzottius varieornatus]|uniref:guanylate cyclase n=1 Tax=Ramazzottius varieornatus TaxID=947166 RepID=A0A1D1UTP3_RAMVA|nr:hypothetical protein RvY_04024 [Ramazzottius varieornatus]
MKLHSMDFNRVGDLTSEHAHVNGGTTRLHGHATHHSDTKPSIVIERQHGSSTTLGSRAVSDYAFKVGKYDTGSIATGRSSLSRLAGVAGKCVDDPRTTKGRRMQLIKILGMAAIPIIILVVQSGISVHQALQQQQFASDFKDQIEFAIQAGDVVHALGLERGTTTFYLSMVNEQLLAAVKFRRKTVDESLAALVSWPDVKPEDHFFLQKQDLQLQIAINRIMVNSSTPELQLDFFTDIITHILKWIGDSVIGSQATEQRWQLLVGYHLFIMGKEYIAAERSCGTIFYGNGHMELPNYLWYQNKRSQGIALLNKSLQYEPSIKQMLVQSYIGSSLEANITVERNLIDQNNLTHRDIERERFWYALMTNYQNILRDIERNTSARIRKNLEQAIYDANKTVGSNLFILLLALALLPTIIVLLNFITGQIQSFAAILQSKNEEVMKEKKRAEAVLNQLLPRQIADKLKNREVIQPESYDQVTVFFSDIVEFTVLSSTSTPLQIVDTLNKLYTIMDRRIELYDVYKVETIGDAYLCVSGLPERNGNKHSYEVASMSLELIVDVAQIRLPHKPDYALKMRIGLHTGPCAAGIIGTKMPRYCVFGDTVNTASRMESHGEPLRVHITTTTHDALRYFKCFEMESRGEIQVKGKGPMTTYWLLRKVIVADKTKDRQTLTFS